MSGRGMTAAMLTELANTSVKMIQLVSMHFSTVSYFTSHRGNITHGGNNYVSTGKFMQISDIREAINDENNEVVIELSGADTASISQALSETYFGVTVKIYIGLINSSNALVADPVLIYQGGIITFTFSEDTVTKTANLTWRVGSIWNQYNKVSGRKTNNHDHQLYEPGDKFFDHVGQVVKDVVLNG